MTPKIKAQQLVDCYMTLFPSWIYLQDKWREENKYTKHVQAKKAATIAVHELLCGVDAQRMPFWRETLKELEKL